MNETIKILMEKTVYDTIYISRCGGYWEFELQTFCISV